jgi:hypothetical protein
LCRRESCANVPVLDETMKKSLVPFLLFFLTIAVLSGQSQVKEAQALKITGTITVDGVLDEKAWEETDEIADFIQFQPARGSRASLSTVVKIL